MEMMSVWKFQILPARPGILGERYQIDKTIRTLADEVNDALRYPFRFHKVNKIVIKLGECDEPDYIEALGVGIKQYKEFDLSGYLLLEESEKERVVKKAILDTLNWLIEGFDDSTCFLNAKKRLNWNESEADA